MTTTKKKHGSDSATQSETERELIAGLGKHLRVPLRSRTLLLEGFSVQLDGYFSDGKKIVAVEAFARIGKFLSGQKRKIKADILKLILFDSHTNEQVDKHLVFADPEAATFVQGKSWAAAAVKTFDINIHVAPLSADTIRRLQSAQSRQQDGMAKAAMLAAAKAGQSSEQFTGPDHPADG